MLLRHIWKCGENMLTCVRVFVGKVRIQIFRSANKCFNCGKMSEVKLANIDGEELRRELEILFEDKEKRVFFMQMLATSVKETNELLNVVTLMLESPEILQNPESKMKICEFLKKHKGIIADLSESMKVFL